MFGDSDIFFAPEDCVPDDTQMKVMERKTNLTVPFSTPNEERAKDKLPPVEGGDIVYRPMSSVPLDSEVQPGAEVSEDYVDDLVGKVMAKATEKLKRYGISDTGE